MNFFSRVIHFPSSGNRKLKRLGYKLLIVNADDMGLSFSANMACAKALEKGTVTSASIMVLCPAAEQAIMLSKYHKNKDFGIHLTLTSEWPEYKWKPILGKKVPSLTDSKGYFYQTCEELEKNAVISEVEQEWTAQIELALKQGMNPSHLDSHMFSGMINSKFLRVYINLGRKYKLPVLLNRKKIKSSFHYHLNPYINQEEILVDRLFVATPGQVTNDHFDYYRNVLRNLKPGINCLLIHPAYDDLHMNRITRSGTAYNSAWRQADHDFFMSDECRSIVNEAKITLIKWRDLSNVY